MKILFDIGHPAQLNFFKNSIKKLSEKYFIYITYVNRGQLSKIIIEELGLISNCNLISNGYHRGTIFSVVFDLNIIRPTLLFLRSVLIKPDIVISSGYQAGIYPKVARIPSIQFSDDLEKGRLFIGLMKFFNKEIYFPFYSNDKIKPFNALKEWAYLSPKYFIPNKKELFNLGLNEKEYIFVREVSTNTMNYRKQNDYLIESIINKFPEDICVVLSLENKNRINAFPKNWIILNEPVQDIHSILYFAKIVISSGDSMAREGALLGVPSIYSGIRKMFANKVLIDEGMLFHKDVLDVPDFIDRIMNDHVEIEEQNKFRKRLKNDWIDITEFVISKIEGYIRD
jgi:hypothetical protein|tara:strand:+ start:522 stop:1544 length:1023 start_codon:yes stop_codon:yes gene_type:complete